jgi:hypothetical protein
LNQPKSADFSTYRTSPLADARGSAGCNCLALEAEAMLLFSANIDTDARLEPSGIYLSIKLSNSISKSISESHFLNYYLKNHLYKNRFVYLFTLQQFFYISCALAILAFYFCLAKNPK